MPPLDSSAAWAWPLSLAAGAFLLLSYRNVTQAPSGTGKAIDDNLNSVTVTTKHCMYTIREVPGKGKGLFATTLIPRGTRILSEVPIFLVPRDEPDLAVLDDIVVNETNHRLTEEQRHAFFDLHVANAQDETYSRALGIARTNVLPLGPDARLGGLFLDASRINHSCSNNAHNNWNEHIGRLTIHAMRDIQEGDEITITYMGGTHTYAERQRALREGFNFDCSCELCSLPPAERELSDARLSKLRVGEQCVLMGMMGPEDAFRLVHSLFGLIKEEGVWNACVSRCYNYAYEVAMYMEDRPRARVFAERSYEALCVLEGEDSPTVKETKGEVEELSDALVPSGLTGEDLERWLWMLD